MLLEHKNLFTLEECKSLIELCSSDTRPISASNPYSSKGKFFFTPENNLKGNVFDVRDKKINWVINRLCTHLKINLENLEHPRFQEYSIGGTYRNHYDFILLDYKYTNYHLSRGGQRIKSFVIYLNDDYEGGETIFPKQNIIIKPEAGKVIEWTNINPNIDTRSQESYNWSTLHGSLPVTKGIKYVFAIFEREQKFIGTSQEWLDRFPSKPSKNEDKVKGIFYGNKRD